MIESDRRQSMQKPIRTHEPARLSALGAAVPAAAQTRPRSRGCVGQARATSLRRDWRISATVSAAEVHDVNRVEDGVTRHDFPADTQDAVVILGAGLAGLAAAAGLHRVGIPAYVLERAPELRQAGNAIQMWPNSFRALDALGVGADFTAQFNRNKQIQMWDADNTCLRSFDLEAIEGPGRASEQRSIGRAALLSRLASTVPRDKLFFSATAASVEDTESGAVVRLKNGQELRAKVVVGAEGVNSPTASYLGLDPPTYSGYVGVRGLVSYADAKACGALVPQTFVLVWGLGNRFGLVPLNDTTCYWFASGPAPEDSLIPDPEKVREEALRFVAGWKWPAADIIRAAPVETLQRSRIFDRLMPGGKPFGKGSVTLMGDSQHVSTPNLGQGGCAAIEDAVEFTRILRLGVGGEAGSAGPAFKAASKDAVAQALREYEVHRTKRTSALVERARRSGYIGDASWPPFAWARNIMTTHFLSGKDMFSHIEYDPGTL